ncbi:type VI secretion system tip protein TssI/VgrG [Caballeronia sp. LZ032]|uniref:type VI secretion system tip protein TssI/VgrG n=1 Tax=Caballeronia sp. LZ032 TaxID=3038565 RepID=UPI0028643FDF|nr:type VI secretion system tip protein TssI/VgrG [Caballeronia sp. LZ032]MDR5884068.1 type VI secretion system tip protein TssI/VgrG [Caballeronia sp. LZ032]
MQGLSRTLTVSGPALPILPAGEPALLLSAIDGEECLSTLYRYEILLSTPLGMSEAEASSIDVMTLIGKELTVTVQLDGMDSHGSPGAVNVGAGVREISGVVMEAGFVERLNRQSRYRVLLRPWLALAELRSDFRIYQQKTIVEIVEQVFGAYLYPYEWRLSRSYPVLDYQVQYGETDYRFVQRLLAEHGIYWFFEHSRTFHRMVLVDHVSTHTCVENLAYQTLWYYPPGHRTDREHIEHFDTTGRIQTGVWSTGDYHFEKPAASLLTRSELPQATLHNTLEHFEWPGDYADLHDGEQLARVRIEELRARGEQASGSGNVRDVVCGTTFTLAGHPQASANREYLVLAARLTAEETGEATDGAAQYLFQVQFDVQPATTLFRPSRQRYPKPRTAGPQTAIVTGAPGSEIWTDQYGRVKIAFYWNRHGSGDQDSSCWVRVSYPWAGSNFGGIHIPRVGTEVIVDFEHGDPDRPIVIGRVYNAMTMPPWRLPDNATQSGMLTRSSKDGGYRHANAIRFEDKRGAEQLWIQAERNLDTVAEHDESHTVGHDRTVSVGRDQTDHVARNRTLRTDGCEFETISQAAVSNVGLGRMLNIGLAYSLNVGGLYLRNIALQMASTVGNSRIDRVVRNWTADVGSTYTVTVRGAAVGAAVKADLAKPAVLSPESAPELPAPLSGTDSNQLRISEGGDAHLSAARQVQLIGPGGKVTIDDSGITLEATSIRLKSPVISMTSGSAGGLAPVTEADCAECSMRHTTPHPVDVATGQKNLFHEDFILPGRIPVRWSRAYRSADQRAGSLGIAWKLPYATEIRRGAAGLVYFDADGRQLQFPALDARQEHFHAIEKTTLARCEDSLAGAIYVMRFSNGVEEHYAPHPVEDSRWQLQRITNRDSQALTVTYTPQGWLQSVRNNVHTVSCTLDDSGRITAVTLKDSGGGPSLCLASYAYDAYGDLIAATNQAGLAWHYTYRAHLLESYRTPAGAVHVCEWDGDSPHARVTRSFAYEHGDQDAHQVKRAITRDTRFAYSPATNCTRVTDSLGRTTEYHYNGLWAVDRVLYPDGGTRQVHFDQTGSVSGHTDELGRSTRIINDARGNAVVIVDAGGNVTRMVYDDVGQPVQITDPAGQVWLRAYDEAGHLIRETDPLGHTATYAYESGLLVAHTNTLGNITRMQRNSAGQMIARTDCSGNTTRHEYDALDTLTRTTDPLGNVTRYERSSTGRFAGYQPADMGWWRIDYDDAGRAVSQTDPLGRVTRTTWDAYGQRIEVIDAAGGTQRFEYDAVGRVNALINANGEAVTFAYDSRDRLVEQTGFDGRRQSFHYNLAGEMIRRIDHGADGQIVIDIVHDALGRPVEHRAGDGSQTSYRYDARGLLTQAQKASPGCAPSQITFEYDAAGRRTAEVQAHHGRVWRLDHELDALGHRRQSRIPGAGTLEWQRYGSGHVHEVLLNGMTLASFERDALHRETLRVQGMVAHHFAYGPAGWLAEHRWQSLNARGEAREAPRAWRSWSHDRAGQVTALCDAGSGQKQYRYDVLSRLVAVSAGRYGNEAFTYDPAGNLLAVGSTGWTGRSEGDRLHALVTHEVPPPQALLFDYDGHGNRTSRTVPVPPSAPPTAKEQWVRALDAMTGVQNKKPEPQPHVTRYSYDSNHQLTAIHHDHGAKTHYQYDALGRRIAKHHTREDGSTHSVLFVWDGDWMMQEVWAGKSACEDGWSFYVPHPERAGPLVKIEDGATYHYVTDHLGTPQEMHDHRGELVWAADFTAYGATRLWRVHAVHNPIRFPGQHFDDESGLHYNRFRYYDPQAGRYLNQDPIGLLGGANSYAYADNRPLISIDPVGLAAIAAGAEMGAAGGTAIFPGIGTIVGGVVGAVAGIGVTVWIANAISTDKAGNKVSSIADTMQPPGNCTPGEQRRLQEEVNRACKRPRSCKSNMDQPAILQMRENNRECAMARDLINKKCFAGGDANHRNEALEAWANVTKCEGMMK